MLTILETAHNGFKCLVYKFIFLVTDKEFLRYLLRSLKNKDGLKTSTQYLKFVGLIVSMLLVFHVRGQDLHWAQFAHSPLNLSPALTGVMKGDMRFIGNYRSQWTSVPVSYQTFSVSFDKRFDLNKSTWESSGSSNKGNMWAGVGAIVNYDRAGDSKLSWLNLGLNGSFTIQVSKKNFLTAGFQAGFIQRSFQADALVFDDQYDEGQVNTNMTSADLSVFNNRNMLRFDMGAGFNWHFQETNTQEEQSKYLPETPEKLNRTKFDLGVGFFHLNQPQMNFLTNDPNEISLPIRYAIYGIGVLKVDDNLDLLGDMSYQFIGRSDQLLLGTGVRVHIDQTITNEIAIDIGLSARFFEIADAIIPRATLHYKAWRFGLSYDINLSDFELATNNFGGPEFSVRYMLVKVPDSNVKLCPIY